MFFMTTFSSFLFFSSFWIDRFRPKLYRFVQYSRSFFDIGQFQDLHIQSIARLTALSTVYKFNALLDLRKKFVSENKGFM